MNDETKPLVFEQVGPDCLYLREALTSTRWGAFVMVLLGLALEATAGQTHSLARAIVVLAIMGLIGGALPLWAWVGGGFEKWSGHLPTPGHFAWLLGATAVGAVVGCVIHAVRFQGFVAHRDLIWFSAGSMGAMVGAPVAVWRTWLWLGCDGDPPSLVDRGIALSEVNPVLAITSFTTALRVNPRYARAAYERARLLEGLRFSADIRRAFKDSGAISMIRREDAALLDLDSAIRTEPGYAAAYLLRARVTGSLTTREENSDRLAELWATIRADLTHAIEIDPGNAEAYFRRGNATPSGEQGEMEDYDRAVELGPEVANYRLARGRMLHARGEFDRAIVDFDEVIRLDPGKAWHHQERAEAFLAKGDYGRSEEDLARARSLNALYSRI